MDYLSELNPEQYEAATTTEGFIRVVAGAGSGKTKTLTARYMYLVEQLGISTANILCVTFTNKAAAEMKKRIRKVLPDQDLGRITTFHGFCVGLLKEDCHVVYKHGKACEEFQNRSAHSLTSDIVICLCRAVLPRVSLLRRLLRGERQADGFHSQSFHS